MVRWYSTLKYPRIASPGAGWQNRNTGKTARIGQQDWEFPDTHSRKSLIVRVGATRETPAMLERIAKLEQRMDSVIPTLATSADVERLRADVHKVQSETKAWVVRSVVAFLMVVVTLGIFIAATVRPAHPPVPAVKSSAR